AGGEKPPPVNDGLVRAFVVEGRPPVVARSILRKGTVCRRALHIRRALGGLLGDAVSAEGGVHGHEGRGLEGGGIYRGADAQGRHLDARVDEVIILKISLFRNADGAKVRG